MNINTIVWLIGGGIALVAISIVINITIISPKPEAPLIAEERAGSDERSARLADCEAVQAKIDAEIKETGKSGAKNFSPELQEEIAALKGQCIFIGDEEGF